MTATESRTRVAEAGAGVDIRTIVESIGGENRAEQVARIRELPPNLPEPEVLFRRKILTMNFDNAIEQDASNMWLDSTSSSPFGFLSDTSRPYGYEQYGRDERDILPGFGVSSITTMKMTSLETATEVGKKRNFVIPPSGKVELVIRWMSDRDIKFRYGIFVLQVDDGSQRIAKVRTTGGGWSFWNSSGVWTSVTGGTQGLAIVEQSAGPPGVTVAWHETHLAVDFINNNYLWLVSDNLVLDVNGQAAIQTIGTGNRVKAWFEINMLDWGGGAGSGAVFHIWLDKVDLYELVTV